jgi:GAF domain-containing protein
MSVPSSPVNWPAALDLLREAGARINRLGPATSLREALQLIAETAVQLIGAEDAAAVIYTYDAAQGAFDPASRVSAGERVTAHGDVPRPDGVGACALRERRRVLSYESGLPFHPLKYQAGIRTAACYPLLVADQPVGALYVDLRGERRFSEDELRLLDTLVQLSAVAIYNTRQFEGVNRALQRKVEELERLQRAGQLISSRPGLADTLHEILDSALKLIGAEHGSFRLLDRHARTLRLAAWRSHPPEAAPTDSEALAVSAHSSVMGWVAHHRRPARIADLREPPWNAIYYPLHPEREMRSELAVPLLGSGGGLEGVLNLESPRLNAFSEDAERVLTAFATQASIAIQEAKLLNVIEDVTGELVSRSPTELFQLLIERACDLLDVPHGAVWELDAETPGELRLRAANTASFPDYRVPLEGSLLGEAILTRRPVYSADLASDPRLRRRKLVMQMKWVSALVVPLLGREGAARGVFGVYATEARAFSDWDTRLLASLANHAAVAIQQAEALAQARAAQERQAVAETFAVLGDISANLLHRVNNQIGLIPALAQGLLEKHSELARDATASKRLADIEASARAAVAIIRETFAFLRPLQLRPVSVRQSYQAAAAQVTRPAQIEIASYGLSKLPPVLAGEEQLRLVLYNLLENAVEALGDSAGRITVSGRMVADVVDRERCWVEIAVADDGPGISAENRAHVFDATFSTKPPAKKLGFGLWWVKSWVQRFGGVITLAEPAPAGGAAGCTFVVRLPLAT